MEGLRGTVGAVFAVTAIGQFVLYWAILGEHRAGASRASFALMRIPRKENLTRRGQAYARWWWRVTAVGVGAWLILVVTILVS